MTTITPTFADPEVRAALGDDPELLAIADAIAATQGAPNRRRFRATRVVALAATIVLLLAAPAYALVHSLVDFSSKPPAADVVVEQFSNLNRAAPAGLSPNVASGVARHVADFGLANGSNVALSVAPTQSGGFCEDWGQITETCNAGHGDQISLGSAAHGEGLAFVFGDVLSPKR